MLRKVSVSVGRMLIYWNCCNNLSNIIRDSILEDFFVRFVFSLQMASDGLCCGQRGNYSMSVLLWTLIRTRELSADCSLHTGAARKHRSTTTLWTRKYILVPLLRKPNPSELESHMAYIERSDAIAVGNMGRGLLFPCNTNKQSVVFEQRNRQNAEHHISWHIFRKTLPFLKKFKHILM